MFSLLKNISREQIAFFGLFVIIVSLMVSKFVLTIGMIILIVNALWNKNLKNDFSNFLLRKDLLILTSLFFICLLSSIFSSDYNYFVERMRTKLPFLFLPFAFSVLKPFSEKKFYSLLAFFLLVLTISSFGVAVNYFLHFNQVTESYKSAQVMPTPIGHIHFSLMTAFAIIIGIFLFSKNFYLKFRGERTLILIATLFLFIFIHILAVRIGLLALYCGLFGMAMWYIFYENKYLPGVLFSILIVLSPFLAYESIPTFKNKIDYARYDLAMYSKEGANPGEFSDGGRIYSYKLGWLIAKKNLLWGVGYCDIENEMNDSYEKYYPEIEKKLLPHNQFLLFFSSMGIIGLFWMVLVFLFPIFYKKNYKNILLLGFILIMSVAFSVESYIEVQIGTAFYLVFLLLILQQIHFSKTEIVK